MSIYSLLQFNNLYSIDDAPLLDNEKKQLRSLEVDKIHFSSKYPTIFFKEVKQFDEKTLREIVEIQHKLWNYKKVMFLYVVSLTEIRIYNCHSKPEKLDNIQKVLNKHEIVRSDIKNKENFSQLLEIFSANAIDVGTLWNKDNSYFNKIKFDKRVDKFLVSSLINLAKELEKNNIELEVIHSLIMRSLFIMYLEDKKATPEEFYTQIDTKATSYFDLLEDDKATYAFFEKIQNTFNGNIFPVTNKEQKQIEIKHLKILKRCFTNGDLIDESLFKDWRIFKFDIIDIELLSQIYENFLGEMDKKNSGSYYTPPELVELILNEVLPKNDTNYKIKVLDPTCGSGIFLVEAYKRIVLRWQNANPKKEINFRILKEILLNSIYGIELNKNSIKVTTFSLYLAMLDFLNPTILWYLGDEKFPYLIKDVEDGDLKEQGDNLFRTDTILANKDIEKNYDIIVGNPPYGKNGIPEHIKKYCEKEKFSKEFVIPFIHKSTLLAPNGKIALLAPTKILTNTLGPAQNFRQWLFNKNYVEKIYNLSILRKTPANFGGQLFSSAIPPASIYFFSAKIPEKKSKSLEYWSPKTYIKNHLAEGIIIDSSDVKFLPRNECNKPNTKIWKIAQWGTLNDFQIIDKLNTQIILQQYFKSNDFVYGGGFELSPSKDKKDIEICKMPFIKSDKLTIYSTSKNLTNKITHTKFHRRGTKEAYKAPHLLIKEGIKKVSINNNEEYRIVSSFLDYDCSYLKGIIGIHHTNINLLKALSIYINSVISKYFMFLSSSSWGIERDVIKANELFLLPSLFEDIEVTKKLAILFDKIQTRIDESQPLQSNILDIEEEVNNLIFDVLKLSLDDRIFIQECISYTMDLFYKGKDSIAIKPIDYNINDYANKLCEKLNKILKNGQLKVASTIYKTTYYSPLCVVIIQFTDKKIDNNEAKIIDTDNEFNQILSKLNKFTLNEYSKGIYVQKNLLYFDNDKIYIVKPNQKRFWNLSAAIEDAQNITFEIMSMY